MLMKYIEKSASLSIMQLEASSMLCVQNEYLLRFMLWVQNEYPICLTARDLFVNRNFQLTRC